MEGDLDDVLGLIVDGVALAMLRGESLKVAVKGTIATVLT